MASGYPVFMWQGFAEPSRLRASETPLAFLFFRKAIYDKDYI
jgi:hypothetical protein